MRDCLALYPALAGAALLAAAGGLLLAMGLFRLIGPARTRVAAQILAGLIGATFTIVLQLRRYWPDAGGLPAIPRDGPLHELLALPVRAAFGDRAALAAWLGLSLAAFAAAALGLGPAFASDAARAAGAVTSPRRPRRARDPARAFGGTALAQLRSKERLVILRDPWVLSQVMLQILYMLPMGAVLWTGSDDIGLALAPTISVIAFQMSSSLAWLSLSGEDAPDLLATAPLPRGALLRAKFRAVGTLVSAALGLSVAVARGRGAARRPGDAGPVGRWPRRCRHAAALADSAGGPLQILCALSRVPSRRDGRDGPVNGDRSRGRLDGSGEPLVVRAARAGGGHSGLALSAQPSRRGPGDHERRILSSAVVASPDRKGSARVADHRA